MTITDAVNKLAELGDVPVALAPRIAKTLESKFGSGVRRFLGGGGKGFAWSWGEGGLVLKITTDQQEAWAAASLLGKRHPNVGYYKHVAQIDNTDLYAIIQEYAGDPIKDPTVRKLINLLPGDPNAILRALKTLTQESSHPLWPQLLSGLQFIKNNGVKYFDLHDDNVVQRGEVFKIIDVGIGDIEPMHVGRLKLEQKLDLAFSNIEIIII